MHIRSRRTSLRRPITHLGMSVLCIALAAGCASIQGYPDDPENSAFALGRLAPYFDGTREQDYLKAKGDPRIATALRNEIVYARMRAYDIAFAEFERELYGGANSVALGSDLAALVLAGLTATTGNAAMKSAFGAASIGILGAKTAISKDLFYERTIPALLAQMEANRLMIRVLILKALKLDDAEYPLMQAYGDLDAYKSAGSIPSAINTINLEAGAAKEVALDALRSTRFFEDTFSQRLQAYIWPAGIGEPEDKAHVTKLRQWMVVNLPKGLQGLPIQKFLDTEALAKYRKKAVEDLAIP
jgi:hypothetical protein